MLLSHNSQHIHFSPPSSNIHVAKLGAVQCALLSPLHNHGGYESISIAALKSLRMLFDSNFGVIKPLDEIRRSFGFCPDRVKLQRRLCRGAIRPPLAGAA
jgi:anti-sigma factor ChrR (cupin superfamily)